MKWIAEVDLLCPQKDWKWALLSAWETVSGQLTGAYFCQRRITSELLMLMQNSEPAITGNSGCSEWLWFSPFKRMMRIGESFMLILACVNESLFAHLKCTSLGPSLLVGPGTQVRDVGTGEFIHHPPNALMPCSKPTFGGIHAQCVCSVSPLFFPPLFIYVWIAHRVECS